MKNQSPAPPTIIGFLLLIYWIPVVALSAYSSSDKSWTLLVTGLMLSAIGTISLWLLIRKWEQEMQHNFQNRIQTHKDSFLQPQASLEGSNPQDEEKMQSLERALHDQDRRQIECDKELEERRQINAKITKENERYQHHIETLKQELEGVKNLLNEQLAHYKNLLNDHQKTISELRDALQSKQQVTMQLESKVRDLSYEIKTILQIAEGPQEKSSDKQFNPSTREPSLNHTVKESSSEERESSGQIQTFEEALMLLKRCLDSAQRIPGASHFVKSKRFKDLPLENYALDLRRLFDHFQNEVEGILFLFSHKEEKMLFVTEQIDKLLGINAEKFLQTFQELIHDGKEEWNSAINQLSFKNESKVIIPMKSRTGQEIQATCVLGMIPTGIFRNHILGVLFSEELVFP